MDSLLCTLIAHKTKSVNQMNFDNMLNVLEKLESSIEDLEEVIEFLSRHLIKTRVSLLNILNHWLRNVQYGVKGHGLLIFVILVHE